MRLYDTAAKRWSGVGPYYAMFPVSFADRVVRKYTAMGDTVLDPFAGRGTAVYSAAVSGRHGIGIELNPVGWIYARTKLSPAAKNEVVARVEVLGRLASRYAEEATRLPRFFHRCFSRHVRRFLVAARTELDWKANKADRTLMALLLINLHGKREASLSNQMRQTKAMSPDYSIAWWSERNMDPPDVDPVSFVLDRVRWRYAKGVPEITESHVYLGDSLDVLPRLREERELKAKLLLTSPPYFSTTNYHYDQWLRLWLLGGRPDANRVGGRHRGKFEHPERYRKLLVDALTKAARCLHRDAVVYVRSGSDWVTRAATREALTQVFPKKALAESRKPVDRTQTQLFGDLKSSAEVDFVLTP